MISKKQLAIRLSKLDGFSKPKIKLEQYSTPSEIAATILWDAYMKGDIAGRNVVDLGCGTGILGIGAMLLGANAVYFVDKDPEAIAVLEKNIEEIDLVGEADIVTSDVSDFNEPVDTVLQNPPFGTKQKHADKAFLEKAFSCGSVVYSFHKTTTDRFVRAVCRDHDFVVAEYFPFSFPLRPTYGIHKKKVERIEVTCYRMVKA